MSVTARERGAEKRKSRGARQQFLRRSESNPPRTTAFRDTGRYTRPRRREKTSNAFGVPSGSKLNSQTGGCGDRPATGTETDAAISSDTPPRLPAFLSLSISVSFSLSLSLPPSLPACLPACLPVCFHHRSHRTSLQLFSPSTSLPRFFYLTPLFSFSPFFFSFLFFFWPLYLCRPSSHAEEKSRSEARKFESDAPFSRSLFVFCILKNYNFKERETRCHTLSHTQVVHWDSGNVTVARDFRIFGETISQDRYAYICMRSIPDETLVQNRQTDPLFPPTVHCSTRRAGVRLVKA